MSASRAQVWTMPVVVLTAALGLSCDSREPRHSGAISATSTAAPTPASTSALLELGSRLERSAEAGTAESFEVLARRGDLLEVVVEQDGVDIVLTAFAPSGRKLARADSPTVGYGPEWLVLVAGEDGPHRFEVTGLADLGRYTIELRAHRPASESDLVRAAAHEHFRAGEAARVAGEASVGIEALRAGLPLAEEVGDALLVTEIHDRLGRLLASAGDWRAAREEHRLAYADFRRRGDARRIVASLDWLGRASYRLADTETALVHFNSALELALEIGDRRGAALLLNNLGLVLYQRGEIDRALHAYEQALEAWSDLGDRSAAATTRVNLGRLYMRSGQDARALDVLTQAIADQNALANWQGEAVALDLLGELHRRRDELAAALAVYQRALGLRIAAGDERGRLVTLGNLARIHRARGELETSLEQQRQVLAGFELLEDPHALAPTLQNLGAVERDLGRLDDAEVSLTRAMGLYDQLDEPAGRADVLVELATVSRSRGFLPEARLWLEEALEIYEQIRSKTPGESLRRAYFATVESSYEAYVDLLMTMHQERPDAGFDARALAASERARARSLFERIERIERRGEVEASESEGRLGAQLEDLADRLDRAQPTARPPLERQVREITEALSRLQDRRRPRQRSPQGSLPARPEPLGVEEMRRQVLDEESQLVILSLGKARSFLWVLGPRRLASFELPPRATLEASARRASRFLQASRTPEGSAAVARALCDLGREILAPAAAELDARRLLVVGDGALLTVPFAALPDPASLLDEDCTASVPLLAAREIVHLPSASVLAALRRTRRPGTDSVAVIADPVFSSTDLRMADRQLAEQPHPEPSDPERSDPERSDRAPRFDRLPYAGREAEAILAEARSSESFLATGFEATKDLVMSGRLADYRFVHFATHAVLDADHPELSGLVLSALDRSGRPLENQLRVYEISRLVLNADLVTLSACRTALGRDVRAEGLVGMTQAFFAAGAGGLVVSLWNVDDSATAQLMASFYHHLLADALDPAAALRRAQLELADDPRFASPYFWSSFVLQGEGF